MNGISIAAALTSAGLLAACMGTLPPPDGPKTRVGPDYTASESVSGVRAFVYGNRTVLEFDSRPLWLTVQDENGVPVTAEREGRYYRLARRLDHFTAWINTRAIAFKATAKAEAKLAATSKADDLPPGASPSRPAAVVPTPPFDDATALLQLSAAQLEEVRRAITAGAAGAAETHALNARLDRIETQRAKAATVMVQVQFESAQTDVDPDSALFRVLVPAAKAADHVDVRGRTDARVASPLDLKIVISRTLAAQKH